MLTTCDKYMGCKHLRVIDDRLGVCLRPDINMALFICPHIRCKNVLISEETPDELIIDGRTYSGEKADFIRRVESGEFYNDTK